MSRALLLSLIAVAMGACATPLERSSWIEISSPHFEILSTMSAAGTRELALELERFHALIYLITSAERVDSPIPTKIFAFERPSELRQFTGRNDVAGMFKPGLRQNQILLTKYGRRLGASEVILHEYVHFVVRNGTSRVYPIWYDEGFAEFLSSARVIKDTMAIGAIPEVRASSFDYGKWIPLHRIISSTGYSDFSNKSLPMFYAESWALVHYLTLGRSGEHDWTRELNGYLLRVENGVEPAVAFEKAFGDSIQAVDAKIRNWLRQRKSSRVGLPLTRLVYDRSAPEVHRPSEDSVAVSLGQLWLSFGDGAKAEPFFSDAIATNPDNARAHAGLGDALKFQKQWDDAEPHFLRAVDLDPDDVLNLIDLAEYFQDLATVDLYPERREDLLLEARGLFVRSLEKEPMNPEARARLGWTYLALGDDPAKGVSMVEGAFETLPSSPHLSQLLVEAYVATRQEEKAREVLSRSIAVREKGEIDASLREQIAAIRKRLFGSVPKHESVENEGTAEAP
jgi:tetratricopeptide (TPR) repeat protein